MKQIATCLTASSIAMILFLSPPAFAAGRKKAAASPSPSASPSAQASASPTLAPGTKLVRVIPFHGMIAAVDSRAKTFTIATKTKSRVFKISDQSVITKTGAAATMKDIAEKEEVRGTYWKEADGTLMAKTVKLGPFTPEERAADDARKARRAERKAAKAAAAAASSASPTASPSATP